MRVIAGIAGSIPLLTIAGNRTRPTTDKIKETLFNILSFQIEGRRCLDLFAGSGGLGIEALSRGAASCTFVEKNPKAVSCIEANLKRTHLEESGRVLKMDALQALSFLEEEKAVFDLIFLDPPYGKGLEGFCLKFLASGCLLSREALLVLEVSGAFDLTSLDSQSWMLEKRKEYKHNQHLFIRRKTDENSRLSGKL